MTFSPTPTVGRRGTVLSLVTSADEHDAADDFLQVQQVAVAEAPAPANGNSHRPELGPRRSAGTDPAAKDLAGSRQPHGQPQRLRASAWSKTPSRSRSTGHTFTLEFANQFTWTDWATSARRKVDRRDHRSRRSAGRGDLQSQSRHQRTRRSRPRSRSAPRPSARDRRRPGAQQHSPFLDEVIAVFGGQVLDDTDVKG